MDRTELIDKITAELGPSFDPAVMVPKYAGLGRECLFVPAERQDVEVGDEEVTPPVMGKIWSGQGLFPIIKDPCRSVFDECRFNWFAGFSTNARSDFVYYLDRRDPMVKGYFRGESLFMGEGRKEEVFRGFSLFVDNMEQFMKEEVEAEVVFHIRDFILREKTGDGFVNTGVPFSAAGR